MSSTTGLCSSVLGTSSMSSTSGTATLSFTHSSSRAPSGLQGTPLSPLTSSPAPFWLSGSRLKVLAFTTMPSAAPTRLSLVRKHGPKYRPLCHLSSISGSSCCRLSTAPVR
eukprot:1607139-Amphidinium_carterae.1